MREWIEAAIGMLCVGIILVAFYIIGLGVTGR